MDINFLPQLDGLSTFYSDRYASYLRYTDQQERVLDWISDRFDEEITSQLVSIELEEKNAALSVLGIGSGDGKLEVNILKQLMMKFRLIECTVVEPSAERITRYKKLVEEQKDDLNGVTFDWRQESFQEFCKANANGSKKFHFVSAIHSLYSIAKKDLDFYLKAIIGWTQGKILIIRSADTSCFARLQIKFRDPSSQTPQPLQLANDIMDSLKTLSISFETAVLPCELDVTNCFDSDSQDGKLLLDFLLNVVGCGDDGPPKLLEAIREFLKSECISFTRNGKLYAPVPTQIFVAST